MSCFDFVVTDLDGTLFYDRENICDRDRDALHRLKAQASAVPLQPAVNWMPLSRHSTA